MPDDNSTNNNPPTPVKEKEPELWGVPMSTWYGIGIVTVGTISLLTAIKVLLPPNFQLFPQQQQQQQQQFQPNIWGNLIPQQQPQTQQQIRGNGNAARPQLDNVEEYEVYDEYKTHGPNNIDIDVGPEQNQNQNQSQSQGVYEEDQAEEAKEGEVPINTDLIKTDDRAFRTHEPLIKNNSGIQITESADVVNSRRRGLRAAYTNPTDYGDIADRDYE
jgi:hypothetical protein